MKTKIKTNELKRISNNKLAHISALEEQVIVYDGKICEPALR
jgi:hypothetical protein